MTFRSALAISALAHSAIFAPFAGQNALDRPIDRDKPMVVDYVVLNKPVPKTLETPKVEIVKKVEVKMPVEAPREAPKKTEPAKELNNDAAKKEAAVRSTKDYINYYQLIREKIRKRLKENYRSYYNEGEARIVFTLTSDGSLVSSAIDGSGSTKDKVLRGIAIESVRDASPFPPFPKALNLPRMSFSVSILFKRR